MIISASRRTDIPKFHSNWMISRVKEGFVDVRNPMVPTQISRYSLDPDVVDGIVFWTKDASPMLDKLDAFVEYTYYFQFTLTPYGHDIELGMPDKRDVVHTFKELADRIGSDRVNWRFDPIIINNRYLADDILRTFEGMAKELQGHTGNVTISFIDEYRIDGKSVYETLCTRGIPPEQQFYLAERMAGIAHEAGMSIDTCAETADLGQFGIEHARCVDSRVLERIGDFKLSRLKTKYSELVKDKSQRKECCCVESIDIGWPNTCLNGCKYCYATKCSNRLADDMKLCDPKSSLLHGVIDPATDTIKDHRGTGDSRDRSFKFVDNYEQTSLPL